MVTFFRVSEHKFIEFQLDWHNKWTAWIALEFDTRNTKDHPGWHFRFHLAKLIYFEINYYDNRHNI